MFPAATAAPFQTAKDETGRTWVNAGRRDGQAWHAGIAVDAGPDFLTVKKFATAIPAWMRNLLGRRKTE